MLPTPPPPSRLQALLGNMRPGSPGGRALGCTVAYAPQSPWVRGGSVRDNVLLGAPLDEAR